MDVFPDKFLFDPKLHDSESTCNPWLYPDHYKFRTVDHSVSHNYKIADANQLQSDLTSLYELLLLLPEGEEYLSKNDIQKFFDGVVCMRGLIYKLLKLLDPGGIGYNFTPFEVYVCFNPDIHKCDSNIIANTICTELWNILLICERFKETDERKTTVVRLPEVYRVYFDRGYELVTNLFKEP